MSWSVKTIGELCDQSNGIVQTGPFGSQLKQSEYIDDVDGIPVVMPKDIKEGSIDESEIARISESKANALGRHMLAVGDIVFPRRGEISKRGYIREAGKYFCGTGCLKIHMPDNEVLNKYLFYYLDQDHVVKWLEGRAIGSTMLNLNTSIMRSVNINFPDLRSQERIVSTLSSYDDFIENNKRRIELLEESARQLYKEWFVRFRFPGHEHVKIINGVPEGWIRTTADQAMDILSGGTPKTSVPDYWDGEIGFFTPKDTTDSVYVSTTEKTITTLGLEKCASNLYPKNTLFITARGTVGNLNLAQKPMAMNQSCYALVGREPITQFYLYFAMQAGIQQVKSRAVGAVFDAIIKDTFKAIPFLVPPKALVDEFTDYVQPILTQIDTLMVSTERLVQARDILLPKLMSGEIAV